MHDESRRFAADANTNAIQVRAYQPFPATLPDPETDDIGALRSVAAPPVHQRHGIVGSSLSDRHIWVVLVTVGCLFLGIASNIRYCSDAIAEIGDQLHLRARPARSAR